MRRRGAHDRNDETIPGPSSRRVALLHQHPLPDYVGAELTVAASLDSSSA